MDTMVALLAGLMIFPAVFAFGKNPAQGSELVFHVLPEVFKSMPTGGHIIGALFFLLLSIAALTSSISMIEVPASFLIDEKKWSRKKSAWTVGILAFLVGVPSALSGGAVDSLTTMSVNFFGTVKVGFLDIMDAIWGELFIVVVALMTSIYAGWVINTKNLADEITSGAPIFGKKIIGGITPAILWVFFIRYVCPIVIGLVLLSTVGII
jgi:NSS family neurotransmitter:Na+ symporter